MSFVSDYSAAPSLLGYLYQCRVALFESLRRLRLNPSISVSIETLDDVVFEQDGLPTEVLQIKHHVDHKANLTNSSEDLWKTIRIWSDLYTNGLITDKTARFLLTTETSQPDSIAECLGFTKRNVPQAIYHLDLIAKKSKNQKLEDAFSIFLSLDDDQKSELLDNAYILDNRPKNRELSSLLEKKLWGFCLRQHALSFLNHLEGWWFRQILERLEVSEDNVCRSINGFEIDMELDRLRNSFKPDSLPIHPDILAANPDASPFSDWIFSKQLHLIRIGSERVKTAAKYFYKASEQRSRWVREELLIESDLGTYDDTLKEEWKLRYDQIKDELGSNVQEDAKVAAGQSVYKWIETEANFPVRPSCVEHFVTRGSYQILSNQLQLGWHPDYQDRLNDKEV